MKPKYLVGRHVNGITLNDLEYLRAENGSFMYFDSIDAAEQFLRTEGVTDEEMEWITFRRSTDKICPHCGGPLFKSDIEDYDYQCFDCDVDFYGFEVKKTERVVVVIERGLVSEVYATDPGIDVEIIDLDSQTEDEHEAASIAMKELKEDVECDRIVRM